MRKEAELMITQIKQLRVTMFWPANCNNAPFPLAFGYRLRLTAVLRDLTGLRCRAGSPSPEGFCPLITTNNNKQSDLF